MTTNNSDYYNYDEEDEHLYDYNKEYDFTNYDELLDGIIDKLQIYGCQHHIDHIEDFLTDYGDLTLAEWSRDLMDPSISDFTLDYIMKLLNNKYNPSNQQQNNWNSNVPSWNWKNNGTIRQKGRLF